jgi:hypothetical protein
MYMSIQYYTWYFRRFQWWTHIKPPNLIKPHYCHVVSPKKSQHQWQSRATKRSVRHPRSGKPARGLYKSTAIEGWFVKIRFLLILSTFFSCTSPLLNCDYCPLAIMSMAMECPTSMCALIWNFHAFSFAMFDCQRVSAQAPVNPVPDPWKYPPER